MSAKHQFGKLKDTEIIKHIGEVESGLACDCVCKKCGATLLAAKGDKNEHHFRHHNGDPNCEGSQESALHKFAKQVVVEAMSIVRTKHHTINYAKAIAEESTGDYRPDLTIELENDEKIYIEVFVTNSVKEIKKEYFVSNKHKSFEIDLSRISEKNKLVSLDELKKEILENHRNREMLYWPKEVAEGESKNSIWLLIIWVGLFILGIITFKYLRRGRRRNRF